VFTKNELQPYFEVKAQWLSKEGQLALGLTQRASKGRSLGNIKTLLMGAKGL